MEIPSALAGRQFASSKLEPFQSKILNLNSFEQLFEFFELVPNFDWGSLRNNLKRLITTRNHSHRAIHLIQTDSLYAVWSPDSGGPTVISLLALHQKRVFDLSLSCGSLCFVV